MLIRYFSAFLAAAGFAIALLRALLFKEKRFSFLLFSFSLLLLAFQLFFDNLPILIPIRVGLLLHSGWLIARFPRLKWGFLFFIYPISAGVAFLSLHFAAFGYGFSALAIFIYTFWILRDLREAAFFIVVSPLLVSDLMFFFFPSQRAVVYLISLCLILAGKEYFQARIISKVKKRDLRERTRLIFTLSSLIKALEAKDPQSAGHSERVATWALLLGRELALSPQKIQMLHWGGLLHDIGKIGIKDSILFKRSRLNSREFHEMKKHPVIGFQILSLAGFPKEVLDIVYYHHECWNGQGYPEGISGDKIPLLARIIAVADKFDALMYFRPYKRAYGYEKAKEALLKMAGKELDPSLVKVFMKVLRRHLEL